MRVLLSVYKIVDKCYYNLNNTINERNKMNKLTIIGYLKMYFSEELGVNTLSIRKLSEICKTNPDMKEYVALFAVLTGREYLCAGNMDLFKECMKIQESENIKKISPKYKLIYKDYETCANANPDEEFKKKIRNRIIEIQADKKISNYRIYTDLSMNPGNVNSFLKNGDCRKLSLDAVRRIWKYVERI